NCATSGGFSPRPPQRPLTKFERRGIKLGHRVWDIVMRKAG
ncbi:MAG: tRNA (guanosine(46)-N7)-methyltransferase TrmB, partial [Gammaproteobacteria bacterium]